MPDPINYDEALRQGLNSLSTPDVSSDFDSRVLASLAKRGTGLPGFLLALKPAFSAMCCSLVVSLAVIYLTIHGPISIPAPNFPQLPPQHIDVAVIDQILDLPNLRADSLEELTRVSAAAVAVPVTPAHRPPDIRHAWLPTKTLVA